jgi:flagellar hook assembly protein FlgD
MKRIRLFFLLMLIPLLRLSAQIIQVKGNVSTSTEVVKNAKITFTNEDDTTKSYTTLTDSLGNYSIGLITSIKEKPSSIPAKFELAQNYPNPFSSSTAISYKLNQQTDIQVTIYDILGREVKTFSGQLQGTGIHSLIWDGKNNLGMRVNSGVYLYRVKTGNEIQVKKMILNRSIKASESLQIQNYGFGKTNLRKEKFSISGGTFKVTVQSDTNTTPLIVIQEFPNQNLGGDTTLNFEMEEARVILYQSIDGVKMGDDSLTVISKLGVPNYISYADLDGYVLHYYDKNMGRDFAITLYPTSAPKVYCIHAVGIYSGKTKEGVKIGMYREEMLKLLGMPTYTDPIPATYDYYYKDPSPGYLKSAFCFLYDENERLIEIQMIPQ